MQWPLGVKPSHRQGSVIALQARRVEQWVVEQMCVGVLWFDSVDDAASTSRGCDTYPATLMGIGYRAYL